MLKRLVLWMCAVALSCVTLGAQTKPAAVTPKPAAEGEAAPAAAKAAPVGQALPVNIKIEVTISDQTGTNAGVKKVVSMIVADRQSTSIRSSARVPVKMVGNGGMITNHNVTINVDALPAIVLKDPTKILVSFGLEYFPKATSGLEEMEPGMASLTEHLGLILESGRTVIVSQAADPASDRKITVEVTATILK